MPQAAEVLIAPSHRPAFLFPLGTEGFPAYLARFIHRLPQWCVKAFSGKDYTMTLRAAIPRWFEVKWWNREFDLVYTVKSGSITLKQTNQVCYCALFFARHPLRSTVLDCLLRSTDNGISRTLARDGQVSSPSRNVSTTRPMTPVAISAKTHRVSALCGDKSTPGPGILFIAHGKALLYTGRPKRINTDSHFSCFHFSSGFQKLSNSPLACLESLPIALADYRNPRFH